MFSEHDLEVDLAAELAVFIYRGTPNSVTGFMPFVLHTGRETRLPLDAIEGLRVLKRPRLSTTAIVQGGTGLQNGGSGKVCGKLQSEPWDYQVV
jgi:hypothetical protein